MNKTTLVVGASGATGRQLVAQLLNMDQKVKVVVRSPEKLPSSWINHERVSIIKASVLSISVEAMAEHIKDCEAVTSCLGHNLSFKGVYGKPRKLVRDAMRLLCAAIHKNQLDRPTKVVLMNTAGNRNRDLDEPISFGQKLAVGLIRLLLPPHVDNEQAADYLRTEIGQKNPLIEWVVVRPDNLINAETPTEYELHPSPIRSAIFNAGTTSRINVGHFMARLICEAKLWHKWQGQMPLIYNKTEEE